jgi:hypothetical protein
MRAVKLYLLLLLTLGRLAGSAQYLDTLRKAFGGRKSLDAGFDARNSFVDNDRISVQMVKLGVVFGKKISMGLGYAWLSSRTPVFNTYRFFDEDLGHDTFITRRLAFSYFRFYVNYIYYKSRRWEFSLPLQAGVGKLGYKYRYNDQEFRTNEGMCFLYEPEIDVKFRILRWLGAEGDVGYRFMLKNNRFIKNTFNSPTLSVGIFIVWNELALLAFPKNEWVQKRLGPGDW